MSAPQGRKPKAESYAYSWFLPADGHSGSAVVSQMLPSDMDAEAEGSNSELETMEARTERWRRSGERKSAHHQARSFSIEQTRVKLAAMVGWSAVVGSGAVLMVARASQTPSTQLGILAAVWLGVSAAVWFLPGLLSRGNTS